MYWFNKFCENNFLKNINKETQIQKLCGRLFRFLHILHKGTRASWSVLLPPKIAEFPPRSILCWFFVNTWKCMLSKWNCQISKLKTELRNLRIQSHRAKCLESHWAEIRIKLWMSKWLPPESDYILKLCTLELRKFLLPIPVRWKSQSKIPFRLQSLYFAPQHYSGLKRFSHEEVPASIPKTSKHWGYASQNRL